LLDDDASQLRVAYTTIDPSLSEKIGEIANISLNDYHLKLNPILFIRPFFGE
jgi:hypothetical protein